MASAFIGPAAADSGDGRIGAEQMIGPIGLLLHMGFAGVVGVAVGAGAMLFLIATGLKDRANERGLQRELDLLMETEAEYRERRARDVQALLAWGDQMNRERVQ